MKAAAVDWNLMAADGERHPAADPPVRAALPRPPRNTSPGVPSVRLRWASGESDGASCRHCGGQRGRQVSRDGPWVQTETSSFDPWVEQIFQAGRAAGEELSSREDAVHPAGGDAGAEASTQGECLSSLQLLEKKNWSHKLWTLIREKL